MKTLLAILLCGFAISSRADEQTNAVAPSVTPVQTGETIVCIRHGEKPKGGRGQLNCRGLNRALALPDVLLTKYGTPQFVFAPDPSQIADGNPDYYYVRPLVTIEPTAIRCGLPVNTKFGFRDIGKLEDELKKEKYQNATIFLAWEHGLLDEFAKNMVKDNGGDATQVPGWPNNDYDTIFVFKFTPDNGIRKFSFTIDREGLNGLSDNYPQIEKK
jgi:hypothetical protein